MICGKNSFRLMLVKSLSVVLLFVIYCLQNIYEGILKSASPTLSTISLCPFNFTVLPHIKLFLPLMLLAKKNITKACTLLYTTVHGPPF